MGRRLESAAHERPWTGGRVPWNGWNTTFFLSVIFVWGGNVNKSTFVHCLSPKSRRSFLCSAPVWLHDHLCGGVPAGSSPGAPQQHYWDSSRRLQVCHSVEETHACPSHWHRSVWSWTSLTPPLCLSHWDCCIFRSELLCSSNALWETNSFHYPSYGDRSAPTSSVSVPPYAAPRQPISWHDHKQHPPPDMWYMTKWFLWHAAL